MREILPIIFLLFLFIIPLSAEEEAMTITSTAFREGQSIPVKYSCRGEDLSPPLAWSGVPGKTASLVLICDDPDAPMGTWIHWVYFDIPPDLTGLPEAFPAGTSPDMGGIQGKNSWRRNSYGGPCPPGGTHRYYFRLYALDVLLNLDAAANKAAVTGAMQGHILAEAKLMGTFTK